MSAREVSYRQHLVIGVTTFCEIIGPVSFALRLWARKLSKANLWWDDYVMGLGLVRAYFFNSQRIVGSALTGASSLLRYLAYAISLVGMLVLLHGIGLRIRSSL